MGQARLGGGGQPRECHLRAQRLEEGSSFFPVSSSVSLLPVAPFFPRVKGNLHQVEMVEKINHHPSAEHRKVKGRKKLHLPLHSMYQSNSRHNHSACFHTYSVLSKINLSKPVIAFFVRIFKKKALESGPVRGKMGYCLRKSF